MRGANHSVSDFRVPSSKEENDDRYDTKYDYENDESLEQPLQVFVQFRIFSHWLSVTEYRINIFCRESRG